MKYSAACSVRLLPFHFITANFSVTPRSHVTSCNLSPAGSSSDVTDSGASDTIYSNITTAAPPVTTKEETTHSTYAIDSYTEFSGSMARALFDFTGDTEDDLCFKSGEEIEVLEWISNEWMKGRIAGRTGIFPSNFVVIIEI